MMLIGRRKNKKEESQTRKKPQVVRPITTLPRLDFVFKAFEIKFGFETVLRRAVRRARMPSSSRNPEKCHLIGTRTRRYSPGGDKESESV